MFSKIKVIFYGVAMVDDIVKIDIWGALTTLKKQGIRHDSEAANN
jgi:hypothetical protein